MERPDTSILVRNAWNQKASWIRTLSYFLKKYFYNFDAFLIRMFGPTLPRFSPLTSDQLLTGRWDAQPALHWPQTSCWLHDTPQKVSTSKPFCFLPSTNIKLIWTKLKLTWDQPAESSLEEAHVCEQAVWKLLHCSSWTRTNWTVKASWSSSPARPPWDYYWSELFAKRSAGFPESFHWLSVSIYLSVLF